MKHEKNRLEQKIIRLKNLISEDQKAVGRITGIIERRQEELELYEKQLKKLKSQKNEEE